jgi:hypothetical protein
LYNAIINRVRADQMKNSPRKSAMWAAIIKAYLIRNTKSTPTPNSGGT